MSFRSTLVNQLGMEESRLRPLIDAYVILQADARGESAQLNAGPEMIQISKSVLLTFLDSLTDIIEKKKTTLALRRASDFLIQSYPNPALCLERLRAARHALLATDRLEQKPLEFLGELIFALSKEFGAHMKLLMA